MGKLEQLRSFMERRSLRPFNKSVTNEKSDTDIVTLNLIKSVAEKKTSQEIKEILEIKESFYAIYNSEQFDRFLLNLLQYFHYFCEREKLTEKQKKDFLSSPSSHSNNVHHKLRVSLKLLGHSYCALIMGLGLEAQHHMNCGKSRVSASTTDQKTFETLYKFCANFVWIAFLRKDRKIVDEEIGRLLRSEKFNPALQPKNMDENDSKKYTKQAELKDDMKTIVTKYQKEPRRPSIKRIIHQKSPIMESVFPSAKDLTSWQLKTQSFKLKGISAENADLENSERFDDFFDTDFRFGILGQQLNKFTEDLEENENKNLSSSQNQQSSPQEERIDLTDNTSDGRREAISRATTEVSSEDEEQ